MTKIQLTDGSPVPEDRSHTEIDPATGMQKGYIVLSPEERAKGFVKPVRRTYLHTVCGTTTTMGRGLAETYARDPYFYGGTFCCHCRTHFGLDEFVWEDGEPMFPPRQEAWHKERTVTLTREKEERRVRRISELKRELQSLEDQGPERHYTYCERAKALFETPGSKVFPQDVPCTCEKPQGEGQGEPDMPSPP